MKVTKVVEVTLYIVIIDSSGDTMDSLREAWSGMNGEIMRWVSEEPRIV